MDKSRQLKDGALLTVIFIVLLLLSILVPIISLFSVFFIAVPFVIFAAKYDWKPSLLMLIVSIILSMLLATIISLPIAVLAGVGGIMVGTAIYHECSPYETWARGTLGFIAGILFSFVFPLLILDVNVLDEFNTQIDETVEMTKQMVSDIGIGELTDEQIGLLEQQINRYKQSVPVFVVFASIILALTNQWISYKVINQTGPKKLRFPKFRNLRFPTAIIWIYLFAIIGTLFQNDASGVMMIALQNVIMLTGLLMIIQGFSFIFFYTHHKNLSIAIPIITVVLTLLFAPLLLPLVRILGIIDLGFGLRNRMGK